jgi:hypothetical protein
MNRSTSLSRPLYVALAAATVAAMACGTASAQTTFTGFTNGCFGACTPESDQANRSDVLAGSGLTYNNSTFSVTAAGGMAGLGSTGMATPAGNVDNLGSWSLSGLPFSYTGGSFTLRVSFTGPPGTAPASALFTSTLLGTVVATDNGGLFIDFDNTPKSFTLTGGGTFTLLVNDVSLTPGATPVGLTGFITDVAPVVTSTPEPATYALLLAGLGAVGFMARRRKS